MPERDPDAPATPAPAPATRSGRRLSPTRRALYRLAVPVAMGIVRAWWSTCRVVRVVGDEHVAAALAAGPVVPVYWHQHALFCVRYLVGLRERGLKLGFLISPSVDGELPSMLAARAGVHVLRGSSSYTGARALRDYYVALRDGVSPALTPDGPSGPRHAFKPGAILVSQISGRPMLPLAYAARRAWRFRTWDRFVLPWPFTTVAIAVGAPRTVPKGLDADGVERWQREMARELESLYRAARDALSG